MCGKRQGAGKSYYEDGTLNYDGGWQHDERHGKGKEYNADGTVKYDGKFVHNVYCAHETGRKRKLEKDTNAPCLKGCSKFVGDVPTCSLCLDHMHHGDSSFAYVPCGHRVCGECEKALLVDWRTRCPMCKKEATQMIRIY